MTKTEKRELAKDVLQTAIGQAYYMISEGIDGEGLTEQEKDDIIEYINQYGKAACKAFKRDYITY